MVTKATKRSNAIEKAREATAILRPSTSVICEQSIYRNQIGIHRIRSEVTVLFLNRFRWIIIIIYYGSYWMDFYLASWCCYGFRLFVLIFIKIKCEKTPSFLLFWHMFNRFRALDDWGIHRSHVGHYDSCVPLLKKKVSLSVFPLNRRE